MKKPILMMVTCLFALERPAVAQTSAPVPVLEIKADQVTARVSPRLYGLMTEEINYSYEGGLYGELIRNRTFQAKSNGVAYWDMSGNGSISLDASTPLNAQLPASLKLDARGATKDSPVGIVNGGYWGIPVKPKTTYLASFYAKTSTGFDGPIKLAIQSADGRTTYASVEISGLTGDWGQYEVRLMTKNVKPTKDAVFKLTTTSPGTLWLQQVSLFPSTFNDRANGNRPDLMQLLAEIHPKFLRLPGGNYLEGRDLANRFDWQKTIGDIAQRPGHESPWGYWSTDGLGLLEYLEWCEDLHMEPLLAVFAGYTLNHEHVEPGPDLQPCVQSALDEIEYITGDAGTTWGAQRVKDGHPAPFPLHYIEVGNEDWFDRSGSYDGRFAQFFDAIKAKYPGLQIIATARVKSRTPDLLDEHYYRSLEEMEAHALDYDQYSRTNPTKIFVGEWATRVGSPTPNLAGALGDAAWMTGMERNSDIVLMHSYAPLFVNVSDLKHGGSMQWPSDLIGYDALTSYGSPSYYAQKMFSAHLGDTVLATDSQNIPTEQWQPPAHRRNGVAQPRPPVQTIRKLFFDATRDQRSGIIYLKVVNTLANSQLVRVEISGAASVAAKGAMTVLSGKSLDDTNTIQDPARIVPVTTRVKGLGKDFTRTFPPYSITILEVRAR
jgi:alpha-N-arabinofuranosidase